MKWRRDGGKMKWRERGDKVEERDGRERINMSVEEGDGS